ncbi:MAG: hypothetical protein OXU20_41120 [Myxococcales bacterium]|nr:hypothetical protein [Myxococcales bacterium]
MAIEEAVQGWLRCSLELAAHVPVGFHRDDGGVAPLVVDPRQGAPGTAVEDDLVVVAVDLPTQAVATGVRAARRAAG